MAQLIPGGFQVLPEQLSSAGSQMLGVANDVASSLTAIETAPTSFGDPAIDGPIEEVMQAARAAIMAALGTTNAAGNDISLAANVYAGTNTTITSTLTAHHVRTVAE